MVSTGQMVGMAVAILLPVLVAVFLGVVIGRHSRKIETGMLGAVAYGFLGFLWQQLFYLVMIVVLTNFGWLRNAIGSYYVISAFVYGLVCSAFVALGLYWGIYLTNQKQRSLFRSTTIGVGFGLGNIAWNIVAPYGMSLYYSIQINAGSFAGSTETKASILATASSTMYLDSLKCILFLIVYMGVAHLMSKYYLEGNKIYAWGVPVVVQLFISLTNALMKQYLPEIAAKIGIYVVLALLSAASVWMVWNWLKESRVSK